MLFWDPFEEMENLRNVVNQIFEGLISGEGWPTLRRFPPVELSEEEDKFVVVADMPGVRKDDISVNLTGNLLSISGRREVERPSENASLIRSERRTGEFKRTIELPSPVDGDKVKATFKDGILTMVLPKREESKVRAIAIES